MNKKYSNFRIIFIFYLEEQKKAKNLVKSCYKILIPLISSKDFKRKEFKRWIYHGSI